MKMPKPTQVGYILSMLIKLYGNFCEGVYTFTFPGDHWGDLDIDGWIILGWISRRWDVGMWTGLGWHRIGTGGGRL